MTTEEQEIRALDLLRKMAGHDYELWEHDVEGAKLLLKSFIGGAKAIVTTEKEIAQ